MDMQKLKQKVEEEIDKRLEKGIITDEIKTLGELIDIHKDIANEEYWDKKKEVMQMNYSRGYREYGEGSYNEGNYSKRGRDSRGRYSRRGNFREGEEMMDEMFGAYQSYSEGKEQYGRGNYGHTETMKSLEYMMESVVDFVEMLKKDAGSQEEVQIIQKHLKHLGEM